jgi:hypothetical protein
MFISLVAIASGLLLGVILIVICKALSGNNVRRK